jgi:glycosyltransferase involved in cell wall biosynthesis
VTSKPRSSSRTTLRKPQTAPCEILYESGRLADARATVCITLYNYGEFICETLMSVYDQSLDEIALVVLDDVSTDDGCSRVESWMRPYASRFAGLCLARHKKNQGLAGARNGAVSMSESEAVMILDADNLLYPRCVERLLESLEGAEFGFAYSIIERFGGERSLISCYPWDVEFFKKDNYVDAMALIRKSVWSQIAGYSRMQVAGWEDYDFWCKCVEAGYEGLLVPEILARYRLHGASMLRAETNRLANALRVRDEMAALHPWLELKDISSSLQARRRWGSKSPHALLFERTRGAS